MSNRGHNSIAAFSIHAKTSELEPLQRISTGGDWPRNFAIDPSGKLLLVANQRSNDVHSFRIDQKTGRLTATGHSVAVAAPVCLRFIPRP
jgi:6-phosphogluconolactonase